MKKTANSECIEVCNRLLRGELSAVETYDQTIRKFENDPAATTLRRIRDEHQQSAARLQSNVAGMGGEPATDSGAWGTVTQAAQGVAKMFGESAALKGLQQGEEHGLNDYQDALDDEEVMPECKQMIRSELMPRTRAHIETLRGLAVAR